MGHSLFLLTPMQARGTNISLKVLHKHLLHHRHAREAKVWVEVGDRAHRFGLQRHKGVSTLLQNRLSLQISWLYMVCFYYLAFGQAYYLIFVHRVHSSLHYV